METETVVMTPLSPNASGLIGAMKWHLADATVLTLSIANSMHIDYVKCSEQPTRRSAATPAADRITATTNHVHVCIATDQMMLQSRHVVCSWMSSEIVSVNTQGRPYTSQVSLPDSAPQAYFVLASCTYDTCFFTRTENTYQYTQKMCDAVKQVLLSSYTRSFRLLNHFWWTDGAVCVPVGLKQMAIRRTWRRILTDWWNNTYVVCHVGLHIVTGVVVN